MNINPSILLVLLIVVAVVIVGPIVGLVILFRRFKSPRGRVVLTTAYFGIPFSVLFLLGFIGSSRARVERDHSLALPVSASHIRCGVPISITTFGDFSADVSFDISASDFTGVLSAFTWDSDTAVPEIVTLSQRMYVPPQFGEPTSLRTGKSRDGNRVYLQAHDLQAGRLGVCIYTMWN